MNRNFDLWMSSMRDSIADYGYYINFEKVYEQVNSIKIELNILNSLIGSKNIEKDFETLVEKYPEILKCIPILLAVRELEIFAMDSDGEFKYNFKFRNLDIHQYSIFMRKTGLFQLISNKIINNLFDYVTGVETGLSTNGRKNRGGHLMEHLLENYIKQLNVEYYREMYASDIEKKWGIDLSPLLNDGKSSKRFDYVIKCDSGNVFAFETNFYGSSGSKLNETARSYKMIATESKNIPNFYFVWITDGKGWNGARKNLEETFDMLDHLYNVSDLESGVLHNIIK